MAGILDRPLMDYRQDRLRVTDQQVRDQLDPMLSGGDPVPSDELNARAWQVLFPLLALTNAEREYTERLQVGELRPDLLCPDDDEMAERLSRHPALLCKARNAREHAAGRRSQKRE